MKFILWGVLASTLFVGGCSSRNLYPEMSQQEDHGKREVVRREWTYPIEPQSSQLQSGSIEYISPVLDDNILLFGSSRFGLVALYPNLLRERWKIEIHNGVVSPIEVKDHIAYYTEGEGNLTAASIETGKSIWTYALRNPVSSRPTVDGKDLYLITSDDAVISIESQTGKWQWHYRRRNVSGPTIHGAASPLVVGDTVIAGFSDGALVALSRKEGKVLWEKQLSNNKRFADLNGNLILHGDSVFVSAYDNALYCLNARTGTTVWSQDNLGGSRGVEVSNGVVYTGSSSGYVYALDEKSGKILWKFELDHPVASGVTVLENHIAVASSSQYFYLLNRATGKLEERLDIGFGSGFSGPFIYDSGRKTLYGLSRGGNLLALAYRPH